jgi:hypothetical protein
MIVSSWECAKSNGFLLVSLDADFAELAARLGPPPKVIWLRAGNQPTTFISTRLRFHAELVPCQYVQYWLRAENAYAEQISAPSSRDPVRNPG